VKKNPILIAAIFLAMITTSCRKPEETVISKYFQAMKSNDKDTLYSIAADPVFFEFKSWKLISSDEEMVEGVIIPALIARNNKLAKEKTHQLDLREAYSSIGGDLEEKDDPIIQMSSALLSQIEAEMQSLNEEIKLHEKLIPLSLGLKSSDPETYSGSGKCYTFDAIVKVIEVNEEKEYLFRLRRYEFINPATKKPFWNRPVIWKIDPLG